MMAYYGRQSGCGCALGLLAVLLIAGLAVGFWRGWFEAHPERVEQDVAAARQEVQQQVDEFAERRVEGRNDETQVVDETDADDETHSVEGRVTSSEPEAGRLRIESDAGQLRPFAVDERTRFEGQAESLVDLQPGDRVRVVYASDAEGETPTAVEIAPLP